MIKQMLGGLIALSFVLNLTVAMAADDATGQSQNESAVAATADVSSDLQNPEHTHWDFITCVCTDHECEDEADHHHYDHWKTQHDHKKCSGHEDLACYGGHH